LKCTSPMDVYLLLKSSDFISHDISPEDVFDGCEGTDYSSTYQLELVLRKWYHVDPSREFRCFVRQNSLLGISQRDYNFYDFMLDEQIQAKISDAILNLWTHAIKGKWATDDYIFDVILTRNLESGHVMDFNPFAPRTDPLLFSYQELLSLHENPCPAPTLKFIDSRTHSAATRSAPANVHNMVPFEMLSLGAGQSIEEFSQKWQEEIQKSLVDEDGS